MKAILYMAQSLNGMISRVDGDADFVSEDEWKEGYIPAVKKTKCIIVGRNTHEVMINNDEFDVLPHDTKCIVVTKSNPAIPENHIVANSPQEALSKAKKLGFEEVLIAGGTELNSSFLKEKLVNEIVLDVEPCLIPNGKNLFSGQFDDISLSFINMKKLTDDLIQLRYKVNDYDLVILGDDPAIFMVD